MDLVSLIGTVVITVIIYYAGFIILGLLIIPTVYAIKKFKNEDEIHHFESFVNFFYSGIMISLAVAGISTSSPVFVRYGIAIILMAIGHIWLIKHEHKLYLQYKRYLAAEEEKNKKMEDSSQ